MAKYELSKEWLKNQADLIQEAYLLSKKNNYKLQSTEDVLEIIKIIDPENASEENAKIFSGVLQLFTLTMKQTFDSRSKRKQKTVDKIGH